MERSNPYQPVNNASPALQIAPGQGFMVKAKDDSETFIFTKAIQNHQSGTATFYRTANTTPSIVVNLTVP
ncbi:MAG: hypothetical protein GKR88_02450 [Flavobacteriaceae bacterium]|nr:MAG: hypothetical protein GKR88_02450 [Flavobacteriaceae bacterium]